MSLPRQIRTLLKLAAVGAVLVVAAVVTYAYAMRQRIQRAQELYDSVPIGDSWQGLAGFEERDVTSDPDSQVPPQRRYDCRLMFIMPISWEIVVGADGRVVGKHRYD
jgi:hypothetical protein